MTDLFNHEPDEALGRILRAGLTASGHQGFVQRTLALIAAEPRGSSWDVLGTWLRPGLVAAAVIAFVFSMWLRLAPAPAVSASLADAVGSVGVPASLIASSSSSSADNLLAAVVEGR